MFSPFHKPARPLQLYAGVTLLVLLASCNMMLNKPAGSPDDVRYARQLWSVLEKEHMAGKDARELIPFIGAARPHGWVLEVDSKIIQLGEHAGFVVVKKNYRGDSITVADVERDRAKYLESISVMFQRAAGYDPENQNWFWVQYHPDGQLFTMRKMGMNIDMAGRLVKGDSPDENRGCIYCHRSAGGGDYIFYPDIIIP